MQTFSLDWIQFKNQLINNGYFINYTEKIFEGKISYEVFVIDRQIIWNTILNSEADILDFENNYKDEANQKVDTYNALFYAEKFRNIVLYQRETDLSNETFTEIISISPEVGKIAFLTDILFSGTEDGELIIKLNGYEVGYLYYGKRQFANLDRQIPFVVPGGYILSMEFKPTISGANVALNIGGYKL